MHDGKSEFLLCLASTFKLLNKISIKVILIYWLALPCYHVAVIQVIFVGTPFKIIGPIVCLDFIFVINHQPWLIPRNEVQGYKPMHLVVCIVTVAVTQ